MRFLKFVKRFVKAAVAIAAVVATAFSVKKALNPETPQSQRPIFNGHLTPPAPIQPQPTTGEVIMTSLHETRNTCGKINAVIGAVATTADAIYSIFGNNRPYYGGGGYGYNPGGYGYDPYRRVDPLIIETTQWGGINTFPTYNY